MSERKSLNFGLLKLGVVGLDPRNQNWLTKIRAVVLSSILSLNYVLLVIEFFAKLTEIDALADTGEMLVSCHQCFTKMLTILITRPKIERLLEKLARFKDFATLDDELREDVTSTERRIHFVLKVYYHNARISAITMVFKPLIMKSRIFPIQVYNFIDLFQTPYYQIVYGFETLSIFYLFYIIIGFDITFFSIVTYIYNELKIIKYQFQHLKITESDLENGFKRLSEIIAHHDYVLR
ncbi:uncharacterized protein LOC116161162 [Photinus pyralis]|uniref:uncharacterized protein LOC116161162 n=1 Tax=Photinus pyralis TaxID=7054 RepID=UPI0012670B1C|nr:uncharacterized protein LOC116161162 [Photinus pyralis]